MSQSVLLDKLSEGAFKRCSLHFVAASTFFERFCGLRFQHIWSKGILIVDSRPLARYLQMKQKGLNQIRGTDFMRAFLSFYDSKSFLIGGNQNSTTKIREIFEAKTVG